VRIVGNGQVTNLSYIRPPRNCVSALLAPAWRSGQADDGNVYVGSRFRSRNGNPDLIFDNLICTPMEVRTVSFRTVRRVATLARAWAESVPPTLWRA